MLLQCNLGRMPRNIFVNKNNNAKLKYTDFFKKVRANKESEDKGAISQLGKAIENIEKYSNKKGVTAITTPKLAQILFEENIITDKAMLEAVLLAGNSDCNVKVFCSEKFDMYSTLKTMNCSELVEKIINAGSIHINF
jgi:hypothetical protein